MEKIKTFIESDSGRNTLIIIIVILVGLISFGFGRLSKQTSKHDIEIEYQKADVLGSSTSSLEAPMPKIVPKNEVVEEKVTKSAETLKSPIKAFFASNRGRFYYHLGCTGGKTLKQENLVYFNTEQEAINAGYTKSTSCK